MIARSCRSGGFRHWSGRSVPIPWSRLLLPGLVAMGFWLGGCSRELEIPKPNATAPTPPPPIEPSVVQIPVTINLSALSSEVERVVPAGHRVVNDWMVVEKNPVGDMGLKFEVSRDPLQLSMQGNTLSIAGNIKYWVEVAQKIPKPFVGGYFWQSIASCGRGEALRQATVGLQTKFTWGEDWRLTSATSVRPTEFRNKCQVTLLKIDVTNRVNDAFEQGLRQGAAIADNQMKNLGNFRSYGERAWKQLQEPVELAPGIWLVMDPSAAHVSSLNGSGSTVTAAIGFTAAPRVVYGPRPSPAARPLPKLATRGAGEGFHVMVEGDISFADAERELVKAVVGKTFKLTAHDVKVVSASLWGAGDQVVVQLGLAEDIRGTIYFVGRPAYDPRTNMLYIRDLDYSLETKASLASAADWLNHEGFRQSIAEQARWPLAQQIGDVQKRLQEAMNRSFGSNVTARGTVSSIRPIGVYLTGTGLKARVAVDGALRLEVR